MRYDVDASAAGAAWVEIADITGDGQPDLVVSRFGKASAGLMPAGEVWLYERTGGLGDWTGTPIVGPESGIKFPNQPSARDVDGDGDLDVLLPYGFLACAANPLEGPCGGLAWVEQRPAGWLVHDVVPNGSPLFYHHVEWVDFDGDGKDDAVTVGEEGPGLIGGQGHAEAQWFKGTANGVQSQARVIGPGLGSLPSVLDIDGDGDLDLASAQYFDTDASFVWLERIVGPTDNDAGLFVKHVIDATSGPAIQLAILDNTFGTAPIAALGSNHTNTADDPSAPASGVFLLVPGADLTAPWTKTTLSMGIVSEPSPFFGKQGAPGIFGVGDLDRDGDDDILVSGDGDPRVLWLRQIAAGSFETLVVEPSLAQAGGMKLGDLDGDGGVEAVVTGYEDNVIYVYRWEARP